MQSTSRWTDFGRLPNFLVHRAALLCLVGLFCGTVQAQDFYVEKSAPAHGDESVTLSDTVAFSFNKQVAISTDWNEEFVFEPADSLAIDKVSLCLTFLDVCDAGDDIPRHVRYQVEHEPNTDYTWLVYAVQTADEDSMTKPYTLRYTTAPEKGKGAVTGSVAAPVSMPSQQTAARKTAAGKSEGRPSAIRRSLRTLVEGLGRSALGHPVFESPSARTDDSAGPRGPSGRPQARFQTLGSKMLGSKATSSGPYTQILLVDKFSIAESRWSVRAADALIGSSGDYSLDFVRSGSYVPIAVRYTDGTNTEVDALGFHDPDGDGAPNVVDVDGNHRSDIDLQLYEFPRTTARAESTLPVAIDSAAEYATDQDLRWITADTGIDPTGTAYEWTYRFYSASKDLETTVTVNPLEVQVDTSAAPDFLSEMDPIPDGFVDTDEALQTALDEGGQEFVDDYSPRNLSTIVSGGNLYWTDAPDPDAEFWHVRFIGTSQDSTETFERFVNIRSGDVLPVELTRLAASTDGSAAELRWKTASETSNAGFEVQHAVGDSAADARWEKIGFVEGAGTTQEPQTYRYRVEKLRPGTHRFRLRQVDLNGTAHLSGTVTVEVKMASALRLTPPSPNPARRQATLRFGAKGAPSATVALYDALGRKIRVLHEGPLPAGRMQTAQLDVGRLSSGVYFVRLTSDGQSETRRLTVVR